MQNGTTLTVDLRSSTELSAFYRGVYERELMPICTSLLDPDAVFIDVGANIGFYTTAAGKLICQSRGSGIVHAFEPHPGNFARLAHNVSTNSLTERCMLHECGLSDADAEMELVLRDDFKSGSTSGNASIATSVGFDGGFERMRIEVTPLDRFWSANGLCGRRRVSFIKVDIEGHEDFFLRGARAVIESNRPIMLLEINQPYYRARGVDVDTVVGAALPENYGLFVSRGKVLKSLRKLSEAGRVGNVLLIPCERLEWARERCPISLDK